MCPKSSAALSQLLVVTATQPERRCAQSVLGKDSSIRCLQTGIGAAAATAALRARLASDAVTAVLAFGTAAGISPLAAAGQLLLPAEVIDRDARRWPVDRAWHRATGHALAGDDPIHLGALAETTRLLETAAQKRALHARTGAMGADMESAAVARWANEHELPFLVLRAVMDGGADTLPRAAARGITDTGNVHAAGMLSSLLAAPGQLPALWRTTRQFRMARQSLRRALAAAVSLCPGAPLD